MVQAIGSAAVSGSLSAGATAAGLEAQLVRYQKQLSDCVNCDSAKTAEGKAVIDAISSRISEVRARLVSVTEVKSRSETGSLATGTSTASSPHSDVVTATKNEDATTAVTVSPTSTTATVGSRVDVQA